MLRHLVTATISSLLLVIVILPLRSQAESVGTVAYQLSPDPPEPGRQSLELRVLDAAGQPLKDTQIAVQISMPAMGTMPRMEEKAKVTPKGDGHYRLDFNLSMGGTWEVQVRIKSRGSERTVDYSLTTGVKGLTLKDSGAREGETAVPLNINPGRLQRIGVRFVEAKIQPLKKPIRAVGVIESDNTRRTEVTLRYSGYVEKLWQGRVGDQVKAGTALFTVYSPELIAAENEFLLAHAAGGGGTQAALHRSTTERLNNLGLSQADIERIKKRGEPERSITIKAPISGTILVAQVREGSSFSQGELLYTIGDLSKTFAVARLFQSDLQGLRVGHAAEILTPDGENPIPGRIDLISPSINEGEGTANIRVVATRPAPELKPGMFVDLHVDIDLGSHLSIPTTAILYSGNHRYVFVDHGEGRLEAREIQAGPASGDLSEVLSGLKAGERVAETGTFLISSEAQLKSALPKWRAQ